jgi:hypothetical protein
VKRAGAVLKLCIVSVLITTTVWADINISSDNITITDTGMDSNDSFCREFKLTKEQVSKYFRQAEKISNMEMGYKYNFLGCYVRGTYVSKNGIAKWEIRAGGTATVWEPNGKTIRFGCKSCEDGFK